MSTSTPTAWLRRAEGIAEDRAAEVRQQVENTDEQAQVRDEKITRDADEKMSAFAKGNQKERRRAVEHMLVVEKAMREEHAARLAAEVELRKDINRMSKETAGLVRRCRLNTSG